MKQESKYEQVVHYLKNEIESGRFPTGSRLPSIRKLSQDFHCSKDTIQRALLELRYEKYIYSKPQSGYYVLEQQASHEDLVISVNDEHAAAYDDFRLCVNESLIGRENYLYNYYEHQEGLEELRMSVQKLLFDQAIYSKPDQLVMTTGTQQALFILSQIDFPGKGQEILVEQPTYHRMNQLLLAQNIPYQTIERRVDGIDLKELEKHFKSGNIKFFYTIPRFHYPLGHSYSEEEKRAILDLAAKYQIYIVEDDYLGDLDPKMGQTFHYLDQNDLVIYIKSFSTSIFPALRITALILPNVMKEAFVSYVTHFGLAFQIQNDLQDVCWTSEQTGKETGKDSELSKNTYPSLLGVEGAKEALASEISSCIRALEEVSFTPENEQTKALLVEFLTYLEI